MIIRPAVSADLDAVVALAKSAGVASPRCRTVAKCWPSACNCRAQFCRPYPPEKKPTIFCTGIGRDGYGAGRQRDSGACRAGRCLV